MRIAGSLRCSRFATWKANGRAVSPIVRRISTPTICSRESPDDTKSARNRAYALNGRDGYAATIFSPSVSAASYRTSSSE
jgi:hypothetical protein